MSKAINTDEVYELADIIGTAVVEFSDAYDPKVFSAAVAVVAARILAASTVAMGMDANESHRLFADMVRAHFHQDMDLAAEIELRNGFN